MLMSVVDGLLKGLYVAGRMTGEIEAPKKEPSFWENYLDATGWKKDDDNDCEISVYYPPPRNETITEDEVEWYDENGRLHRSRTTRIEYD